MGNLLATFVTFLLLMVGVVVLSLNSFRQAGTIGIVGFLSVGLALFGVRLFGYPLGFNAIIGTLVSWASLSTARSLCSPP